MMQTTNWNTAKIPFYALLSSLILPLGLFALLIAIDFSAEEVPIVGFVFWLMLAVTVFIALQSRYEHATELQPWQQPNVVLAVAVLLGTSTVFAKLSAHYYRETLPISSAEPKPEKEDKYSDPKCRIVPLGEHKSVKAKEVGTEGRVGWVLGIANWYRWSLEIEIEAKNNEVSATAIASGGFSPWYALSERLHNAPSIALGTVACLWEETQNACKPIVTPGQSGQVDKYWISAATVLEERDKGTSATVTAKASAAIGGESAIKEVSVGTKGVGAKMRVPASATRTIEKSGSYSFRCISR